MLIIVGQIVIHPFHGPVKVEGFTTRRRGGGVVDYVDLASLRHPLRVSVPLPSVDVIGIRPILDPSGVAGLLGILGAPTEEAESTWSRRIKNHRAKLQSGRLEDRAAVMRDIIRRLGVNPTAGAERDILREVRADLAAEVALTLNVEAAEAELVLNDAVHRVQAPFPALAFAAVV